MKSKTISLLFFLGILLCQFISNGQSQLIVGFYNNENLFDTIDNPLTNDEDFLPEGKNHWNTFRYKKKLKRNSYVVDTLGLNHGADVMGFCENENYNVVKDLVTITRLGRFDYDVVHQDSPDKRGIDVALVYKKNIAKLLDKQFLQVNFPDDPDKKTRDVLYAKLKVRNDTIHFFVNHWPSRLGGQEQSEGKRIFVASLVRKTLDSIFKKDPSAKIILLGDFNDDPDDKSVKEVLCKSGNGGLTNMMKTLKDAGNGSHYWKGEKSCLDQFIVSNNLLNSKTKFNLKQEDVVIFKAPFLMEINEDGTENPWRTFSGPRYLGGYSDHLPIKLTLNYQK